MRFSTPSVLAVVVLAACSVKPRPAGPDPTAGQIITSERIAQSGASTMWDALQLNVKHSRFAEDGYRTPVRIQRRGASSILLSDKTAIFVDHVRIHDLEMLQQWSARSIDRIQVLSGLDGTTYYGTNAGDGVILIFTKVSDGGAEQP